MYFLPQKFLGVDGLALLVDVAEGDDALDDHVVRNGEEFADDVFRRFAVGGKTTAHLNPAGAEPEVGGLKVHHYGGNRGVFDIDLAESGIDGDDDGEGCRGNRFGAELLAFGQTVEHLLVFNNDKLPRTGILRCRSQQGGFEDGLHGIAVDGLVGVAADAVTL